jgi:GMP synthase (glutamine-hydrolysing)
MIGPPAPRYHRRMARIVVLQHGDSQPASRLGLTLRDHGFRLDVVRADRDGADAVPPDLDDVRGVIALGGLQNVTDAHAWMNAELEFLRKAHDAELPVLGVCLGAQMIAKALGGDVGAMDTPEAGFCPVSIVGPGQTDRVLAGVRWSSHQFQTHAQQITELPPGATLLATSEACRVQAYCVGIRTYAFQYHFEVDRKAIDGFFAEQTALFEAAGVSRDDLSNQCDEHYATFARLADRLSVNIASFAFTFDELMKA